MANSNITISFSATTSSSDTYIELELDDEQNNEESTFLFGDDAYYRIFTNCEEWESFPSSGNITDHGTGTKDVEETITFTQPPEEMGGSAKDNTATLSHTPKEGTFTATRVSDSSCGAISLDEVDPQTVKASQAGVAVYKVTYQSDFFSQSITVDQPSEWPNDEDFPVVVVVAGK